MSIHQPIPSTIIKRIQETATVFTLRLHLSSTSCGCFHFHPGQFNMVYCYGVGEVAISISSDPEFDEYYDHTIRVVGRITRALSKLKEGDQVGIRGPYGHGWPIKQARGKDILLITGGLGCAPLTSMINYITMRRSQFGRLVVLQGIKHSKDMIYKDRFEKWREMPDTEIFISADEKSADWPYYTGRVTQFIEKLNINSENTIAMLCGPEIMMHVGSQALIQKGLSEHDIYLSMERNMHCGLGQCGHCQYGGVFVCKDGPVFPYSEVKTLFTVDGF